MENVINFPPEADPCLPAGTASLSEKWSKLSRRARLFTQIPFIEIVFVAGSMATGDAEEDSDFDLIIGVKTGRIFTVRVICVFLFGLLGWRRKKGMERKEAKDKFCFNHFVTHEKYRLSGPHSESWQKLYLSLKPIYGDKNLIQSFFDANSDWIKEKRIFQKDIRHIYETPGAFKIFLENMLVGRLGDALEKLFKKIQIKKIEKSLRTENLHNPRIIFNDSELEFHPDRKKFSL